MGVERFVEFGMGMISCAQLVEENVDVLDDSVSAEFMVTTKDESEMDDLDSPLRGQLKIGMEGICTTGKRGECPKGHNCGRVSISSLVLPLYMEIQPLQVSDGQ